jgi:hypothetical protein
MTSMEFRPIEALKLNPRNPRTHSAKQIRQIAESIRTFGFVFPILIDEEGKILAGHGRYAAAKLLGLTEVPTIAAHGLSPAKKRALAIADNKIAEAAGWDREILAIELPELAELLIAENVDIGGTGFPPVEIDQLAIDFDDDRSDPAEDVNPEWLASQPVTTSGDLWQLGNHRLLCGDARDADTIHRLMDGDRAHFAGANTFRTGRLDDLEAHPTVKPVTLVSEAIKDCTARRDIVLDTFVGSGTTIPCCRTGGPPCLRA